MTILIWALIGLLSSLCCVWISGFRISKSARQYLEYCLIGCIGGILGAFIIQDVIILLSFVLGSLYRPVSLFLDGILASANTFFILSTLILRYISPFRRKHPGIQSFLVVLLTCILICCILLVTFFLRSPIQYIYFVAQQYKLTNLDANALLVNVLAPMAGGWVVMQTIITVFWLCSTEIAFTPAPTSTLLGLPVLLFRSLKSKRTIAYLSCGDHQGPVTSIAWSPDGKQLISNSSNHVCITDTETGLTVFSQDPVTLPSAVTWSSNGIHLVSASQSVKVLTIGKSPFSVTQNEYATPIFSTIQPIWSPNTQYIAVVEGGNTIYIRDAQTGEKKLSYSEHQADVLTLAWSPDGAMLASASKDKTISVWDAITGETITTYQGHTDVVQALAWSPDNKQIASGGLVQVIRVWNTRTGDDVREYQGHTGAIRVIAWSPDGKQLAAGSHDKTVRVWNVAKGKEVCLHTGHTNDVVALQWSPNGKLLASGSVDTSVHIWEIS